MPRLFGLVFFVFFLISTVKNDSSSSARQKRADIDLQTCIDNFNVHRDKIIRTQDSQNMGAKYLNEIDLGSREECLRLCCETEDCDVFVFEEKNSGSCYLFHCGPPEDFKCKFTHHANYSSAVLSVNRHLPDLESQIKLTKHEQDLNKLRRPDIGDTDQKLLVAPASSVQDTKTTSSTSFAPVLNKEVIPSEDRHEDSRKCSRYQFECRSTGECIAIYNACDGIPQCADASDEAPELGCPSPEAVADAAASNMPTTAPPVPRKVAPAPPVQPIAAELPRVRQQQPQPQPSYVNEESGIIQQPSKPNQPVNVQPMNINYHPVQQMPPVVDMSRYAPSSGGQISQEADFLRPVIDPRTPGRTHYEPVQPIPHYVPQIEVQGQSGWVPRPQQSDIPQVQMPLYQDEPQTFRKPTNLQSVDASENVQNSRYLEPINSRGSYKKVANYYGDNYRQPVQQDSWSMDDTRYGNNQQRFPQKLEPPQPEKGHHHVAPYKNTELSPVLAEEKPTQQEVNPKHVQEKLAHDLKHSKENMEHATQTQPSKSSSNNNLVQHHETYADVVAVKLTPDDDTEDGVSLIPRGAILSLALGLIITSIMAILIGCRLRVVKRRLRKGGKAYAHDADFLVNGMYL